MSRVLVACSKCGKKFPAIKEFFYADRQKKTGLRPSCKNCDNIVQSAYAHTKRGVAVHKKANVKYGKTTKGQYADWKANIKKLYGITPEEYTLMSQKQRGLCLICGKPETMCWKGKRKILCIDHNHDTGKIRGLLCNRCNKAIGLLEDDVKLLRKAIKYLEDK